MKKSERAVVFLLLSLCLSSGYAADVRVGNADPSTPVADGAVLALAFDDTTNPLRDDFGNAAQLERMGGSASSLTVVDDPLGQRGKVGYSDGSAYFLGTSGTHSLDGLPAAKEDFTITMWVKPTAGSAQREILGWGYYGKNGIWATNNFPSCFARLNIEPQETNGGVLREQFSGGFKSSLFKENFSTDDKWHFVAVVAKGQNIKTYVDDLSTCATSLNEGHPEYGSQNVYSTARPDNFTLLAGPVNQGGNGKRYVGYLDDVVVLPRAASAEELARLKDGSWKKTDDRRERSCVHRPSL